MIIYKATNKINGKSYIGQSVYSIFKRMAEHRCSQKQTSVFHKAIRKYGWDNFIWEVLCECDTKDELDEMEFHYIKQYHSHSSDNGYNMTWGGEGTHGYKHTEETKKRLSIMKTGSTHTEEWKQNHSNMLSGRKYDDDHKQHISDSLKGKKKSKQHIENMRLCQIGKTHSKETKKKMSDIRKGHNWNKKGSDNILSKQYIITYPDGHKETIIGINQFCKDNNLNTSNMIQVAKGKRKQHKRFKCCYKEIICERKENNDF